MSSTVNCFMLWLWGLRSVIESFQDPGWRYPMMVVHRTCSCTVLELNVSEQTSAARNHKLQFQYGSLKAASDWEGKSLVRLKWRPWKRSGDERKTSVRMTTKARTRKMTPEMTAVSLARKLNFFCFRSFANHPIPPQHRESSFYASLRTEEAIFNMLSPKRIKDYVNDLPSSQVSSEIFIICPCLGVSPGEDRTKIFIKLSSRNQDRKPIAETGWAENGGGGWGLLLGFAKLVNLLLRLSQRWVC